ncbi:hypothetical protein CIW54_22815 [Paraburkholderia sp. T12-10]|nr:hypothetical protein CIW54_22815 [Paraburkholderia sp. T12-10]
MLEREQCNGVGELVPFLSRRGKWRLRSEVAIHYGTQVDACSCVEHVGLGTLEPSVKSSLRHVTGFVDLRDDRLKSRLRIARHQPLRCRNPDRPPQLDARLRSLTCKVRCDLAGDHIRDQDLHVTRIKLPDPPQ